MLRKFNKKTILYSDKGFAASEKKIVLQNKQSSDYFLKTIAIVRPVYYYDIS